METRYYVFIMADKGNESLSTGISRDLKKKMEEKKAGFLSRFLKRNPKLVYYEVFYDPYYAAIRERKIKSISRQRKMDLVQCMNKDWRDLYEDL